jgi:hypothetical protein
VAYPESMISPVQIWLSRCDGIWVIYLNLNDLTFFQKKEKIEIAGPHTRKTLATRDPHPASARPLPLERPAGILFVFGIMMFFFSAKDLLANQETYSIPNHL